MTNDIWVSPLMKAETLLPLLCSLKVYHYNFLCFGFIFYLDYYVQKNVAMCYDYDFIVSYQV